MAGESVDLVNEVLARPYLLGLVLLVFTPGVFSFLYRILPLLIGAAAWTAAYVLNKQKPKEGGALVEPTSDENRLEFGIPGSATDEVLVAAGAMADEHSRYEVANKKDSNSLDAESSPQVSDTASSSAKPAVSVFNKDTRNEALAAAEDTAPVVGVVEKEPVTSKPLPKSSGPVNVLFLYGSQTGNAMEIAKSFNAEAPSHGIKSQVLALSEKPLQTLAGCKVAVFVVSSTGDGDPPENCERFYHALKRRTNPQGMLSGLQYTVCGLGDSNYTTFMGVPRVFNSKLADLGAKPFFKSCEADEVDGLEEVVEKWASGMWDALKRVVEAAQGEENMAPAGEFKEKETSKGFQPVSSSELSSLVGVPPLQLCRVKLTFEEKKATQNGPPHEKPPADGNYTKDTPFWATVTAAHYMTADWSDRKVIHMELDISRSTIAYRAGDSIAILPQNNLTLTSSLLARLDLNGDQVFSVRGAEIGGAETGGAKLLEHVGWPCTLREALAKHCDLTAVPRKGLLRILAEYCEDEKDRDELLLLCSRGGRDKYKEEIQEGRPSLLDLLLRFPSCHPPISHLLDALPPLVARLYSITCSQSACPDKVQVAFSVVKETFHGRAFEGVCTCWLEQTLSIGQRAKTDPPLRVPIFHKPGGDFHLPDDLAAPLLMVGPGTGVAPFRGFLQERRQKLHEEERLKGSAWLFAGCRQEEEDFLYRADLQSFVEDGTLDKLIAAFSRATDRKVYVQHKMLENGADLMELIKQPKAHIFICGDGANMAREVHEALATILQQHGGMTDKEAAAFLIAMFKEKRFVKDVWS